MRGYPLLQLLLVGCLFAAAGFPVWKLTRGPSAVSVPTPSVVTPAPVGTRLEIEVDFLPPVTDFRLSNLGKTVLEGHDASSMTGSIDIALPKEGADFVLEARWPNATNDAKIPKTVARVRFEFPDRHIVERSFWSEPSDSLVEIVTVTP